MAQADAPNLVKLLATQARHEEQAVEACTQAVGAGKCVRLLSLQPFRFAIEQHPKHGWFGIYLVFSDFNHPESALVLTKELRNYLQEVLGNAITDY